MKQLLAEQNNPSYIQLLQASAVAYRRAKRGESVIAAVVVVLALAYPPAYLFSGNPALNQVLFGVSFLLTIIILIVTPLLKANTSKGALFKEEFDCAVFGLPWKSTLPRAELNTVAEYATSYKGAPIHDWYATTLAGSIPVTTGIAVLQKTNTDWDISLRSAYRLFLIIVLFIYSAALWALFIRYNTTAEMIFSVHFSVLSFYTYIIDSITGHTGVIRRRDALAKQLDAAIRGKSVISKQMLRDIQDEIYASRLESAKVPDFFFRFKYKRLSRVCNAFIAAVNQLYAQGAK